MGLETLPAFLREHYEVHEWKHACAILSLDFPAELNDICEVLAAIRLRQSWVNKGCRRKSWQEKRFDTEIPVDDKALKSPTHAVECFKNQIALESEWNKNNPFYYRAPNNFRAHLDRCAVPAKWKPNL